MPRQPNRRPKIYQGGDGDYHCYVTVGRKPDGSLDRRHLRGRTATQVAEALEQLGERVRRGGGVPQRIETVGQWLEHWLEHVVKPARAWKTWSAYRALVVKHVVPAIGSYRLDGSRNRLEPEHVEAMYAKLRRDGLAPSYVVKIHRVLRKALKDANRRGKAGRNVCDLIDPPTARKARVASYSLADAQAIIKAAAVDELASRWLIGILLGLRQGEVLGLRWHRVHLDADQPHLQVAPKGNLQRRTWEHGCDDPHACGSRLHREPRPACPGTGSKHDRYHRRGCPPARAGCPPGCTRHAAKCPARTGGGIVFVDPKSEKGERDAALPAEIVEALRVHRERQMRDRFALGKDWDPRGLVFTGFEGGPIDPRRDHEAWERLLVNAGVADGRLHAARHTAGTLLVATGTDIRVVQEILGHSDIRVTEGYVDVAQDLKRAAVDRIAAALFDGQLATLLQPGSAPKRPGS